MDADGVAMHRAVADNQSALEVHESIGLVYQHRADATVAKKMHF
jgi:hypothetical protein